MTSLVLCMPAGWSGRFWARTECDFGLFSTTGAFQGLHRHRRLRRGPGTICVGGKCLLDCSTGGTPFCQGGSGLNNANACCYGISGANVCSFPGGTVCKTGDCSGLYQCTGVWDDSGTRSFTAVGVRARIAVRAHLKRH